MLRRAAPRDQSRAREHLKVLGNRLETDRERLRQLVDGGLALRQPRENLATGRVGERREGDAEVVATVYLVARLIK
jgi:hypothetical protein